MRRSASSSQQRSTMARATGRLRKWASLTPLALTCSEGAPYTLEDSYMNGDFFGKFDFFNQPDPSHGHLKYVDATSAFTDGIVSVSGGRAYIGLGDGGAEGRLNSIRLHSSAVYNRGLFVIDLDHMPTGCGTWPAFWLYGEDALHPWPMWGEYDIIEALHVDDRVKSTLHTTAGCQQSSVVSGLAFTEEWDGSATNCDVHAQGQYSNQGCSQLGPPGSAGADFNGQGGGTFAGEWDPIAGHFRTWFWPRGAEPANLRAGEPDPDAWGTPYSYFSLNAGVCDPGHFQNMRLVIDLNLCGDLGNSYFGAACPLEASGATCEEFVSNLNNMREAYWSIISLDVYQRSSASTVVLADSTPADVVIGQKLLVAAGFIAVAGAVLIAIGLVVLQSGGMGLLDVEGILTPTMQHRGGAHGSYAPQAQRAGEMPDEFRKARARTASTESELTFARGARDHRDRSVSSSDWSVAPGAPIPR